MEIVTFAEHPELEETAHDVLRGSWPEFIFHDAASAQYSDRVGRYFAEYDILLRDGPEVLAGSWAVPIAWDGTLEDLPDGYDGALARSVDGYECGRQPTTLCVMAAAVAESVTARGLATAALTALRERAGANGLAHVVVPVRPTLKHRYPLTPMDRYARWQREDGLSIDPWIRTHQRMDASTLGVAHRSMIITGSVADWESWTTMAFPESGDYIVPDALAPIAIDREADVGSYVEDNLWMQHC